MSKSFGMRWWLLAMLAVGGGAAMSRRALAEELWTVRLAVDATATSDSVQASEGASSATTALGLTASLKVGEGRLFFDAAFAAGSAGSSIQDATAGDYYAFLRSPKSALGGEWRGGYQTFLRTWLALGGQLGLRAGSATLQPQDESIGAQHVAVLGVDASAIATIDLSPAEQIALHVTLGLASRFWNKPRMEFVDALALGGRDHAFFGPRASAYFTIKNAIVGIELTRYWGGNLDGFEEFTILPYVGLTFGATLAEPKTAPPAGGKTPPPKTDLTEDEAPPAALLSR